MGEDDRRERRVSVVRVYVREYFKGVRVTEESQTKKSLGLYVVLHFYGKCPGGM